MMHRDRQREGFRLCSDAWLVGVTTRESRELEAGDRASDIDTFEWISELYGWPCSFTPSASGSKPGSKTAGYRHGRTTGGEVGGAQGLEPPTFAL
jgi:hypothetical protein